MDACTTFGGIGFQARTPYLDLDVAPISIFFLEIVYSGRIIWLSAPSGSSKYCRICLDCTITGFWDMMKACDIFHKAQSQMPET